MPCYSTKGGVGAGQQISSQHVGPLLLLGIKYFSCFQLKTSDFFSVSLNITQLKRSFFAGCGGFFVSKLKLVCDLFCREVQKVPAGVLHRG